MLLEMYFSNLGIRAMLFLVSFVGLILLFRRVLFIKTPLVPVFIIALIICVLNIAGLLGGLESAAYIIYCVGFIAYPVVLIHILILRKSKLKVASVFSEASFWILIGFTAFLVVLLNDIHLSHYDNFSHWALAAKEMLCLNGMPDASSAELMDFTGYPLGSSLFIYYGCLLIGQSEGIMLILQGTFLVACMLPLLVFNRKLKVIIIPVVAIIYFVLMIEPKVFNLLVDALLACLGFASLMAILYYRKKVIVGFFVSLPMIVALFLVKNSGVFFAAIDIVVLAYFALKAEKNKWKVIFPVLSAVFLGAAVLTWNIHCQAVFPEVVGKHSMTTSNFESILAGKTIADIKMIAGLMLGKLFNQQDVFIRTMIALNIVALCARWWKKLEEADERKVTKVVLLIDVAFVIYFVGIFAMYVFSMPLDEALYLAGYERYMMTAVLYFVLVFSAYLVYVSNTGLDLGKKSNRYAWVLLYFLIFVSGLALTNNNYNIFALRKAYEASNPKNKEMIEFFETTDDSYVMYVPEAYRSQYEIAYFNYLMKYKLHTTNCYPFLLNDFEDPTDESVIHLIRDYDYFIIYDEDDYIRQFAKAYMNISEDIIGTYAIKDYSDLGYE